MAEQCQGWSEEQLEIFKLLSEVDKRLYCPYYEEEKKIPKDIDVVDLIEEMIDIQI